MKKIITLGIMAVISLGLCACSKDVKKLSVEEKNVKMNVGSKYTIKLEQGDVEGVRWESNDKEIAVVNPEDGTVTAVAGGITTVTARKDDAYVHVGVIVKGNDGYVDETGKVVEVFDGVSDITEIIVGVRGGGKEDISVKKGDTFELKAYITPSDSKDKIVWKSGDTSIATVSEDGVLKIAGSGTTTVTAYAPNGVKGEMIVRAN